MSTTKRIRLPHPFPADVDLTGRRTVVTGGGSGLGLVTVRTLARLGAAVVVGVRDVPRAQRAIQQAVSDDEIPADRIRVARLDLLDLDSVRAFGATASESALDLLVLNAGISSVPLRHDRNGIESQFATNHLGHFALTGCVLDALGHGTDPRVVTVSSALYTRARLDLTDLSDSQHYSPGGAYNRSKLANVLFAVELQHRLRDSGSPIRSFAAHPGMARTPLHATYPSAATRAVTALVARAIGREPEPADVGVLAAALSPDVSTDRFWGPTGSRSAPDALGVPFAPVAADRSRRVALWETSARLTDVRVLDVPA
ncbi:SDR family NAD(P)-dependent oxidoreductase [Cellulomonas sp. URHE0023]|uniref:SDR family NAD(P)-dependent oxidoreductase n=1 Tax=Cellulomonas sp. URHE0023 TaxID=1380354 RepID=UPI00068AE530|nr:SDR family NAD(P)-dependent oxidoreductase [Cellulomonas sp. URHE0023]